MIVLDADAFNCQLLIENLAAVEMHCVSTAALCVGNTNGEEKTFTLKARLIYDDE